MFKARCRHLASSKQKAITGVEISFDFSRMTTGASDQTAVWVEDEDGKIIKTIYVSGFTGAGRGYKKRKDAVPHWVTAADPMNRLMRLAVQRSRPEGSPLYGILRMINCENSFPYIRTLSFSRVIPR